MNPSLMIKKSVSYPIYWLNKIVPYFSANTDVLILMYHRIMNRNTYDGLLQDAMYVNIDTFDRHVTYIKKYYDLVDLNAICNPQKGNVSIKRCKPLCCITFDDGWKDFYDNAFPVLKKHDACGTVFLPTDYIGTNRKLWTDSLADIISCINERSGSPASCKPTGDLLSDIENIGGSVSERYEKAIEMLKAIPLEEIDKILLMLGNKWEVDGKEGNRSFLSWEEVKEMRKSGIVSFGSHTRSHKILTTLCEDAIREELAQSRRKLIDEGVVSDSFVPFAYPNGNHTDRIAKLVEEAGYNLAVTTLKGWNRIQDREKDLFQLKRVGIHEDMTSTNSMFACRVHGYY